jgi:hypothetical protein
MFVFMFNFGKCSKSVCQCQEYMELLKRFFVSFLVESGKIKKKVPIAIFYKKKFIFVFCKSA